MGKEPVAKKVTTEYIFPRAPITPVMHRPTPFSMSYQMSPATASTMHIKFDNPYSYFK